MTMFYNNSYFLKNFLKRNKNNLIDINIIKWSKDLLSQA